MEVSRYKAVTGAIGTRGGVISELISGLLALVEVSRYGCHWWGDLGVDLGVIGTSGGEPLRGALALVEGVISELISGLISSCPHVQHEVE